MIRGNRTQINIGPTTLTNANHMHHHERTAVTHADELPYCYYYAFMW